LYDTVASEVAQYPVMLCLKDMTRHQGSVDKFLEASERAMKRMEIEDSQNFIALTTDNTTTM